MRTSHLCIETRRSRLNRPLSSTRVSYSGRETRTSHFGLAKSCSGSRVRALIHRPRVMVDKCGPRILTWPKVEHRSRILIVKCGPRVLRDKHMMDERESRIEKRGS